MAGSRRWSPSQGIRVSGRLVRDSRRPAHSLCADRVQQGGGAMVDWPAESLQLRTTPQAIPPGTSLRHGLDRTPRGPPGAVLAPGSARTLDSIATGGFDLDVPFSSTGLRELAKMDG